jgi:hypothetical protein
MDMEPRVRPGAHAGGLLLVAQLEAHEEPPHGAATRRGQPRRVVGEPRDERPVGPKAAVGHEQVELRMPIGARAMRLQTGHDPHREVALAGQRANGGGDSAGRDAGDLAEQATPVQTVGAQPLGDGEDHLPVRHGREQRGVEPLGPDREALGVTARAAVAAHAGAREPVHVRARVTPDAGEAVLQHAAREKLVGDLGDDGPPSWTQSWRCGTSSL